MQSFDSHPYSDMEASFYHDNQGQREALKKMKSTMSLDFFGAPSTKKRATQTTQHLQPGILGSPDLNMLKLASPELERMIIQQNGMVTTTPTPSAITNPKFVTEEQEAYARGFVDALAELHEKQGDGLPMEQEQTVSSAATYNDMGASMITTMAPMSSAAMTMSSAYNTHQQQSSGIMSMAPYGTPADHQQQQQMMTAPSVVTSCADELMPATSTHHQYTTLLPPSSQQQQQQQQQAPAAYTNLPNVQENCRVTQLKQEEPQIVPNLGLSFSPPVSPINMVAQEKIKLERKRERNRVAARKCRTRKLERISRLEDRVNDLKGQNGDLVSTATLLRDQVCKLKSQIMEHVKSGCQVMMSQNLL